METQQFTPCDQCQQLTINGVVCHEHGCPNAWEGVPVPCWSCGFDFVPEEKAHTHVYCPDCIEWED